jgi:membrane protease YdiL (CAAX protease family)
MLFLLKRTWPTALAALVVLAAVGLGLRQFLPVVPPIRATPTAFLLGFATVGGVLVSDALIHGLAWLIFRESYLRRYRELAGVFRGQTTAAILAGAGMAGLGEELVFRGLDVGPVYLVTAAILFGLLHHIRLSLWPFTLWSILEGLLFAAALYLTQDLVVTMTAHFLHDGAGFAIFRHFNRQGSGQG